MIKGNIKRICITALFCLGVFFLSSAIAMDIDKGQGRTTASAAQESDFLLVGASLRVGKPEGVRFVAQVSDAAKTEYGANAKYGIVYIETAHDTEDLAISYDGTNFIVNNEHATVVERSGWWSDTLCEANGLTGEGYFYSGVFSAKSIDESEKFPTGLYNTPITAMGFVIPESGATVYTERITRSIGYVASIESLKNTYVSSMATDEIVALTDVSFSINNGQNVLEGLAITPDLKIGGVSAMASSIVQITYTSDNESIAKIVKGQVVAVDNGSTTITATVKVDGTKSISQSVSVTVQMDEPFLQLVGDSFQTQLVGNDETVNATTDLTWNFSTNMQPTAVTLLGQELAKSDWTATATDGGYALTVKGTALREVNAVGYTSLTVTFGKGVHKKETSLTAGISSLYTGETGKVWAQDTNALLHYDLGSEAPSENAVGTGTALRYISTGVAEAPTLTTTGDFVGTLKVQSVTGGGMALLYDELSTGIPYIVRTKFYVEDGEITNLLWKWDTNNINASWIVNDALRTDGSDFKSSLEEEVTSKGTLYTWTAYFPAVTSADRLVLWPVTGETLYLESVELFASNYMKQGSDNSGVNTAYTYTLYNKSMGALVGYGNFNAAERSVGTSSTGGRVCIIDDLNDGNDRFDSWQVTDNGVALTENTDYFVGMNNSAGSNALFLTDTYLKNKGGQTLTLTVARRSKSCDFDLYGNAIYAPKTASITLNVVEGKFSELETRYQFIDENSWTITSDGTYPLSYWSSAGTPSYYVDDRFATGTSLALPGNAGGMLSFNQLDVSKEYRFKMVFRVSNNGSITNLLWKYLNADNNISWIESGGIKTNYKGTLTKEGEIYTWTFDIPKSTQTSDQLFLWPTSSALKIYVNYIEILQVDDGTDSLKFVTMSDVHIGDYETEEGFARALTTANQVAGGNLDLILINGDLTNTTASTNTNEQIVTFKEVYEANAGGVPMMYSLGSTHEIGVGHTGQGTRGLFTGTLGSSYYQMDLQTMDYYSANGFRHAIVSGYHFFTLDFNGVSVGISEQNVHVMEEQLKAITFTDPDRPIFVSIHRPDDVSMSQKMGQMLSKYPQVICFNGHIHNSVAREDAISQQNGFTTINTGGLNYYRVSGYDRFATDANPYVNYYNGYERYDFEQILYVEVSADNVVSVRRYDAHNNGVKIATTWTVGAGHAADYTDARIESATACYFTDTSRLIITPTASTGTGNIKVNFSPCEYGDAGAVNYYQVQLYHKTDGVYTLTQHIEMTSQEVFYPNNTGYLYEVPYEYLFEGVSLNDYAVVVTGYDCWNVSSNAMVFSSSGDFVWDGETIGRVEQQ